MKGLFALKRTRLLVLLPISLLIILIAKKNPYIAEYIFARGIYKYISGFISKFTGLVSFSIGEMILLGIPIVTVLQIALFIHKIIHNKTSRKKILTVGAANCLVMISVVVFLFTILCGTNYYRYDFSYYCDFDLNEYYDDDLYNMCKELAHKANEARQDISNNNGEGVFELEDFNETAGAVSDAYKTLSKQYSIFEREYGSPKPVLLSKYMSYTQIVGIFNPFTMEANVNVDVPDYTIPATMCHEMAHLYGIMKEEEANYVAYLACINSGNSDFIYSGTMLALDYALRELYETDYDKYMEIRGSLNECIQNDLRLKKDYWTKVEENEYQQVIAEVSDTVNDTYLKANGQEEGVKSYGEMVKLLIAEYKNG